MLVLDLATACEYIAKNLSRMQTACDQVPSKNDVFRRFHHELERLHLLPKVSTGGVLPRKRVFRRAAKMIGGRDAQKKLHRYSARF